MPAPARPSRPNAKDVLALALAAALVAATVLTLVEALRTRADARIHTAPGILVSVDGTQDHLHCLGDGRPTAVLIGGLGGDAYGWAWVQRRLAVGGRVCAYDRPGYGYSAYRPAEADPTLGARRLAAVLDGAGEEGPFVVVGHSLGGHYARAFAAAFPDDVAALVLVDARPPGIAAALPGHDEGVRRTEVMVRWGLRLAPLGVLRAFGGGATLSATLPDEVRSAASARLARPDHVRRLEGELSMLAALDRHAAALTHPAGVPVLAVLAGAPQEGVDATDWAIVRSLVSDASRLGAGATARTIEDADHVTLLTDAEHADAVADAIASARALLGDAGGPR
jgi:pimeloyl-ACP methyl ester carboxylesterase